MWMRRLVIGALSCLAACATHGTPAPVGANAPHAAAPGPGGRTSVRSSQASSSPAGSSQAGTHLTPDVVLATIRGRYLPGVERCYSRHAKRLGSASDRVTVSFTVDEDGKTRDGDAHGITKRVDGCIRAQVARWTFPAPRAEKSFSLGLQLSTD